MTLVDGRSRDIHIECPKQFKWNSYDLSFASTETKFIKPKTKTQNNIIIFGFFHKKIILLFWLFLK